MELPLNEIICGDALDVLRTLPGDSVDCCVTSPPYFGLRDYGTAKWEGGDPDCDHVNRPARMDGGRYGIDGSNGSTAADSGKGPMFYRGVCSKCGATRFDEQIGLETTPAEYIARLVAIFEEVRRVLKPTGTFWLNIGDSYAGGGHNRGNTKSISAKRASNAGATGQCSEHAKNRDLCGYKPKDLMLIPARVAIALQDAGWWVRSEIIWAKGRQYDDDSLGLNPMPGSHTDRCTTAHEMIYMLTKKPRYYFDWEAIAEPIKQSSMDRIKVPSGWDTGTGAHGSFHREGRGEPEYRAVCFGGSKGTEAGDASGSRTYSGREWTPRATDGYHAEAYGDKPQSLRDGKQFTNQPILARPRDVWFMPTAGYKGAHYATFPPELPRRCILAGCPPDGVVLDPFMGSGTTGLVALELRRNYIGIEINPQYKADADERIAKRKAQGIDQSIFDLV